jgi:APA family basic amino acid/polyamine antiporter
MPVAEPGLQRRLGAGSLAALTVGIIVGSGIFRTPSEVAALLGTPTAILCIWAVGGAITLCLALCLAELAAMFPRAGGLFVYLEEAFGKPAAFLFGWTFLFINPANWAAVSLIFASYIGALVPIGSVGEHVVATAALGVVTLINIASVNAASRANRFFTVVKALALAAIAFGLLVTTGDAMERVTPAQGGGRLGALGLALVAVLWPLDGVAGAAAMVGEVHEPARNAPRGLIGGVAIVTFLYLLLNAAFLAVLSPAQIAASPFVATDAMRLAFGEAGAAATSVAALLCVFGALLAAATCDSRIPFAMAREGLMFRHIGAVHPKFATPHVAILGSAVVAAVYIWVRSFTELAAQFVLGMWLFYLAAVVGLMRLRKTRPDLARPYRVPLYPMLPSLFIAAAVGLLMTAIVTLPQVGLLNLGFVALGLPVYMVWRHRGMRA